MKAILILTIAIAAIHCIPNPPRYPMQWQANFNVTIFGGARTNGTIYYDYSTQQFRTDFRDGTADAFCAGDNPGKNYACSHYVQDGVRYLYFRDVDTCCSCCDEQNGCGLVTPDWMTYGQYQGLAIREDVAVQTWYLKGNQDNYLYVTNDGMQTPFELDMNTTSQFFDQKSYKPDIEDMTVFNLPKACQHSPICNATTSKCTQLQKPIYPKQFQSNFTYYYNSSHGIGSSTGQIYYDFENQFFRQDLDNGVYDGICGKERPSAITPCRTYYTNETRYIYFPQHNSTETDCCICCTKDEGCGIVEPDWIAGGTYQGLEKKNGTDYQRWYIKGNQDNYLYVTNDAKQLPYELDQGSNNQTFDLSSFIQFIPDSRVFDAPKSCNSSSPKCNSCSMSKKVQQ